MLCKFINFFRAIVSAPVAGVVNRTQPSIEFIKQNF